MPFSNFEPLSSLITCLSPYEQRMLTAFALLRGTTPDAQVLSLISEALQKVESRLGSELEYYCKALGFSSKSDLLDYFSSNPQEASTRIRALKHC